MQEWHLESNSGIMLTFHHFDLMYFDGFCDDYINVTHGGTTQQLCNQQWGSPGPIPDPITTSATSMTIKLVTSGWRGEGQTGFLALVGPGVNVTTDVIGECTCDCNVIERLQIHHIDRLLASLPPHEGTRGIFQDRGLPSPEVLRLSKQCRLFLSPSR